jgi:uncharacterized spore protein YtfJ
MAAMEAPSTITGIVDRLRDRAGVETVFGDPIEREGRTIVPVARVSYGFGGGWGSGGGEVDPDGEGEGEADHKAEAADLDFEFEAGFGEGGGFGGGLSATPVGALEITDGGTRFVRFADRRRTAVALLAGIAVGLILGRGGSDDGDDGN